MAEILGGVCEDSAFPCIEVNNSVTVRLLTVEFYSISLHHKEFAMDTNDFSDQR